MLYRSDCRYVTSLLQLWIFTPGVSVDGKKIRLYKPAERHLALGSTAARIFKINNKQITIEYNFIKYSYSYMFRYYGVTIRLTFRTY